MSYSFHLFFNVLIYVFNNCKAAYFLRGELFQTVLLD